MSTRSTISVMQSDGKIKSIYCHWDGYLSNNGYMLLTHYNSEKLAYEIVALGDISSLGMYLYPLPEGYESSFFNTPKLIKASEHSFVTPQRDVTVVYARDRGEELNIAIFESYTDYIENTEYLQDFNYLWKNDGWFLVENKSLMSLVEAVLNEDEDNE